MIVGLTSGVFDLVHYGHLRYLESCKALCDTLLVGVDSDSMVRSSKGPERPFVPELERLKMIQAQRCVDAAFLINELMDLHRIAVQFKVDSVFKHEGFKEIKNVIGVEGTGAKLVIVPDVPGLISTTDLVARIRSREAARPRLPTVMIFKRHDQPTPLFAINRPAADMARFHVVVRDRETPNGFRDAIRYHIDKVRAEDLPYTAVLDENDCFVVRLAGVPETAAALAEKIEKLGYRSWAKQITGGAP